MQQTVSSKACRGVRTWWQRLVRSHQLFPLQGDGVVPVLAAGAEVAGGSGVVVLGGIGVIVALLALYSPLSSAGSSLSSPSASAASWACSQESCGRLCSGDTWSAQHRSQLPEHRSTAP